MNFGVTVTVVAAGLMSVAAPAPSLGQSSGIVDEIVIAPVGPSGNVAGAVTDLVINLDGSMDPSVAGRGLLAGDKIRVTLPQNFTNTGLPIASVFTGCAPNCSAAILIQGWPQHPVGLFSGAPGVGEWTVSGDGTHTIVFEAVEDIVPSPPLEPGIKQLHLLLFGFRNPGPGAYDIEVEAETGPAGAVETGTARVIILPHTKPTVSVASAFNGPPNPNPIYQQTAIMAVTPLPFDLRMWDSLGLPMTDVDIEQRHSDATSAAARLVKDGRTIGHISVVGPTGATGSQVLATQPSVEVNTPITGFPAGHLRVLFQTGDLPGLYTVTLSLAGGNSTTFFVNAIE